MNDADDRLAQHGKVYLTPRWVACGSFDMSQSAREINQEMGIVTNDLDIIGNMWDFFISCDNCQYVLK